MKGNGVSSAVRRRRNGAFQRVFAATIFFGSEDQLKKHVVVDWTRFHFFDEMQLWFNREDSVQPPSAFGMGTGMALTV